MKFRSGMSPTFFVTWITGSRKFTTTGSLGAVSPLLQQGPLIDPNLDALAVTVPRARVARIEPLFVNEEAIALVDHHVFFRWDHLWGRLDRRMVRLDGYFEIGAPCGRLV